MDIATITPAVKAYIKHVQSHIRVSRAFLYGSVVQNSQQDTSDVDLLVISDDFASMDTDERSKFLYRASVGFPYDLHVYGVTNQELRSASPLTTLGQIEKTRTMRIL